jgi:hypothetical protein
VILIPDDFLAYQLSIIERQLSNITDGKGMARHAPTLSYLVAHGHILAVSIDVKIDPVHPF